MATEDFVGACLVSSNDEQEVWRFDLEPGLRPDTCSAIVDDNGTLIIQAIIKAIPNVRPRRVFQREIDNCGLTNQQVAAEGHVGYILVTIKKPHKGYSLAPFMNQ